MDNYIQLNSINTLLTNLLIQEESEKSFLLNILCEFRPLFLEEMESVKLMNRTDTKFIINRERLPELLLKAKGTYSVLEVMGERITPYTTVYFDTQDMQMYTKHHNGKLNRHKVRMRMYENSRLSFLEVKQKSNKGRTSKKRIKIDYEQFKSLNFVESNYSFLKERLPYEHDTLLPMLQNYFKRITLVDDDKTERITIDFGLKFRDVEKEEIQSVDELIIIEIKHEGISNSAFKTFLGEMNVLPMSMSKYCMGMALVKPGIKRNGFKIKLRKINKITQQNHAAI